jgi:hypothetical protein
MNKTERRLMLTTVRYLAIGLLLVACIGPEGQAQGTYCRPADEKSSRLIKHLTELGSSLDEPWPAARDTLKVVQVSASQVLLETREAVCKKASETYDREVVRIEGGASHIRRVYVVRVGDQYAAMDPEHQSPASEWTPVVLMDRRYLFLSVWGK